MNKHFTSDKMVFALGKKTILLLTGLLFILRMVAQTPVAPTALQHKLTLSSSATSTLITVDANNIVNDAVRDNFGAAAYRAGWSASSPSFYSNSSSSNTFLIGSTLEAKIKSFQVPMVRFYQVWNEQGGIQNGLDRIAAICTRFNIPQDKCIVCIEAAVANTILTPDNYQTAVSYAKSQGYGFKYWEISNEPFYTSTTLVGTSTYAQHVKDCSVAIKAVDNSLQVGMAVLRKSSWTDQVITLAAGYYDWVTPHFYALTNYSKYSTMDIILSENYKILDEVAELNGKLAAANPGKTVPILETEWRQHLHGTTVGDGLSRYDGNIMGTLHQAIRMIYMDRDGYTSGACTWDWIGIFTGSLFVGGYCWTDDSHTTSVNADSKVTYLQYLYQNFINNTGTSVVGFTGTCPSYTGKAVYPIDMASNMPDIINTGPITPLMVTKSADGSKLYITVVNASDKQTIPFTANISNFNASGASANMIQDTDIQKWWFQDNNSSFYSSPTVAYSNGKVSMSLPPLSVTFITLSGSISNTITVPSAPVTSSPSTGATSQVITPTLTWAAATGATSYSLQVSTSSSFTSNLVNASGLATLSYNLSSLTNNTKYYWRVNAANSAGTSAWSTVANFTTIGAIPVAPALSAPSSGSTNQAVTPALSWTSVTGATSYSLQVSTSSSFTTNLVNASGLTSLSYNLSGLANNTKYYWRVSASNAAGSSAWSTVANFTTITAPSTERKQVINLSPGWNIISFDVKPPNLDLTTLVQPLVNNGSLVKVQDEAGNFMVNTESVWFSSLGAIDFRKGYNIKVSTSTQLIITGTPVDSSNYVIPLNQGFNIMGYPIEKIQGGLDAFTPIINDGTLNKVQDESGNFIIQTGTSWYSGIDSLRPGQGYYVTVDANTSLNLLGTSSLRAVVKSTEATNLHFIKAYTGNPYSSMNFIFKGLNDTILNLKSGDEIGIFDGDKCVGSAVYNGKTIFGMSAGMNDPASNISGFVAGHEISFKIWRTSENAELTDVPVSFSQQFQTKFASQGTAIVKITGESSKITTPLTQLNDVYPNPFVDEVTFEFTLNRPSNIILEVYNISGMKMAEIINQEYQAGTYSYKWTPASVLAPGIYIYNFRTPTYVKSGKLMH